MRRAHALIVVGNGEGGGTHIAVQAMCALDSTRYAITLVAPYNDTLDEACAAIGARYLPMPLMESRFGHGNISRLSDLLAAERFDVIHAHGTRAAWFISRCRASARSIPLIYSDHIFAFEARRGLARWPWRAIEAYLCSRATYVTTPCESEGVFAERVRSQTATPVLIRHYGIDVGAVNMQALEPDPTGLLRRLPAGAPLIGTVGRLTPQKGVRFLIEAAPAILRHAPDTHIVIVGEGSERAALQARAHALGLDSRIHFTGALARPWSLLAHCNLIALPSLWEGMPLTLLEALALGLPTVVTPVGIASEALRPDLSAGLTKLRDAKALAHAIRHLLDDTSLQERFHREGPRIAARYDIRETQRAFAALYDDICGDICGAAHSEVRDLSETLKRPAASLTLSHHLSQQPI